MHWQIRYVRTGIFSITALLLSNLAGSTQAARKSAPELLPENTLALVRVANTPELIEKFQQTALGRIGLDEDVKPLVSQLYGAASEAFGQVQEQMGLPLNELLAIPQGEIFFAVVGPEEGPPALIALLDAGERMFSVQKLLDKAEAAMAKDGAEKTTETIGEVTVIIHKFGGERRRQLVYFIREGAFVVSNNLEVVKQVLDSWNGGEAKTLADNKRFAAIMNRCVGKEERPQLTWFLDPLEVAKVVTRGNANAQAMVALLPFVGLDGLQSLGGSVAFAQGEFDNVIHLHVLLDNPRAGIIDMLALREGDPTPEPWIPADVSGYTTVFWDVEHSFRGAAKMYNGFVGPGSLENMLKTRVSDAIGVDFEKELFPELEGRYSVAFRVQKPIRLNSETILMAAKVRDAKKFSEVFHRVLEKYKDNVEKKSFGGLAYYQIKTRRQGLAQGDDLGGLELRREEPCVALFDDYILATNSVGFLEQAVITKSDPAKSLANELDYKLIASKIARQAGETRPGFVNFSRPEEGMRLLYELAVSDNTREVLGKQAETNGFFKTVNGALKDNPLPPFAVIAKYLAPGGGMVTSDETGFHYTGFTLKRK